MIRALVVTAGVIAGASGMSAHHSLEGIYDRATVVTVNGVIKEFRMVQPHPFLLMQAERDGRPEEWKLELDNRSELTSIGVTAETLKPGDVIVASGSRAHDGSRNMYARRIDRPADGFWYEQVGSSPRVGQKR